ncbi:VOC family protein [Pseudolysinimonas kribbensis]|uniref:VOC family protein n=1 Tax=Pseudolysinimonas kribbensis TaxID=433641 RepID=UPI0031E07B75
MTIRSVLLNVRDVARSVDFYTRFLGAVPLSAVTPSGADLDLVTGTLRLRHVEQPAESTWVADDLHAGFRHVGFKVASLEPLVTRLRDADVSFHLEPIDAEGGVRITFFYDPDGTLLELVEGALQYHEVFDRDAVDEDWAAGVPDRPRLDHVAETVADLDRTLAYYGGLGWRHMAGIHQPSDPRGFEIAYVRSGDLVLEVFTFARAELLPARPLLDATGFLGIELDPAPEGGEPTVDGWSVSTDPDGLLLLSARR